MTNAGVVGGIVEAARMALQLYLTLVEQSSMTEEEQAEFEASEREKFIANKPENLPEPPE